MHYRGIEYIIKKRSDTEWSWEISVPFGANKSGFVRGSRMWARTVSARAIDVWLLMNPGAYREMPDRVRPSAQHMAPAE